MDDNSQTRRRHVVRIGRFIFRRARSSGSLFITPAIIKADVWWVLHFWRTAFMMRVHPRWVVEAWREMDKVACNENIMGVKE